MATRVPAEFVGRARDLRRRIGISADRAAKITEALLAPLRPRPGFTPMPRHTRLAKMPAVWRASTHLGRLRLVASFKDGVLQISELRVDPAALTDTTWDQDEPALSIGLRAILIAPPRHEERTFVVAAVGLHGLGRRYQRGTNNTDAAVLADLHALASASVRALRPQELGEFAIPAPSGGSWRGMIVGRDELAPAGLAVVRTFLDE